jgi:hypothetical protein
MDDFGNILYLIFIAVSLLGGLWQNYNKQKAKKEEASAAPSYEENYTELFDSRDIAAEEEQEDEARETINNLERKANFVRQNRRIKRRTDILLESESDEEEEPEIDLKDFDAKKAVIYSEILNPPYL